MAARSNLFCHLKWPLVTAKHRTLAQHSIINYRHSAEAHFRNEETHLRPASKGSLEGDCGLSESCCRLGKLEQNGSRLRDPKRQLGDRLLLSVFLRSLNKWAKAAAPIGPRARAKEPLLTGHQATFIHEFSIGWPLPPVQKI